MDLALLVYGISTLENFKFFLALLMAVGVFLAFCFGVQLVDNYHTVEKRAWLWKWAKTWITIITLLGFVQVVLPGQKTAYTMVGAYAAQKVSENEKVQQMSGKVLTIIEQKLDGYIDEGVKEAKEAVEKAKK